MSEMIERVARAICADGCGPDDIEGSRSANGVWLQQGTPRWRAYIDDARAAIEAMREPTGAMKKAGNAEDAGYLADCEQTDEIYRRMIDAALKDS